MYVKFFKRFLDFLLSLIALIVLSPLMIVLMILGTIKMKGNPFFTQLRPGKNEKIFRLIKFRTMNNAKDCDGNLLPDETRLNKYGKILRKTSLDELPELMNILIGQMSIVGPRPLLVKYLTVYSPSQHRRHEVRPGLTGLAMATVRNGAGWNKKFELDIEYIDNITFLNDIKIVLCTVKMVLKHQGINEDGCATNSEFVGTMGGNK